MSFGRIEGAFLWHKKVDSAILERAVIKLNLLVEGESLSWLDFLQHSPLTAEWALRALIDFTLSKARRFYPSMGNPSAGKGLTGSFLKPGILCVSVKWKNRKLVCHSHGRLCFWKPWSCSTYIGTKFQIFISHDLLPSDLVVQLVEQWWSNL